VRTLFDKIWDSHVVVEEPDGPTVLYVDTHLVHEVTSPQAFEGLRIAGRRVRRPAQVVATMDHRNAGDGSADGITVFVFETDVRLRSGATVASVTLPASVSGGQLHVFAIAAG